jgi:heme A synthase
VAAVLAWRGDRGALRVLAGAIIISALTGVPAFFVDVPAWLKLLVAISVLLSVAAVVLMFTPSRNAARQPATD